jgi:putative membrane protein insertion efficiency factor
MVSNQAKDVDGQGRADPIDWPSPRLAPCGERSGAIVRMNGQVQRESIARCFSVCSAVFVKALLVLIAAYRYGISPFLGRHCRFHPSCSEYAEVALSRYGAYLGSGMALKRLCRCHPWRPGGYDPVP